MGSTDIRAPYYGFDSASGAEFSSDRVHRFLLWRIWSPAPGKLLGFVMLNPSTADETRDDPTTVRNMARARSLGYAGIVQGNLYSFRTPSPKALKASGYLGYVCEDRSHGPNMGRMFEACRDVVLACGAHARPEHVAEFIHWAKRFRKENRLLHLGLLKNGAPRHPLLTAYATPLQEWPA